jgi:hypothetical protein
MTFEYITHVKCIKGYVSPSVPLMKEGGIYLVGVRNHPLFGYCYYLLDSESKWTTNYYIVRDSRYFKEITNSIEYVLN